MLVPRASNSCAALTRSALCAWVDRAMWHNRITPCDANQAQIRNANPRWSAQSGSYLCVQGVSSPLLANVYLHYVLDPWADRWRRREATGDMIIVRYADDVVAGFEREADARRFLDQMRTR